MNCLHTGKLALALLAAGIILAVSIAECPLAHHAVIDEVADRFRLDWYLIAALIRVESGFKSTAVSQVGACGLMQLMPETAKDIAGRHGLTFSHQMLFDPSYNVVLGCTYLKELLSRYNGDEVAALAAYNAGPQAVDRWLNRADRKLDGDRIEFEETRQFVRRVQFYRRLYRAVYAIPRTLFRR